jgi:hypothetical protein
VNDVSGWAVTEWAVAITAILTAAGLVWRKVVAPIRSFVQHFKAWMARIENATTWTEQQMRPNGGSTLLDKVDHAAQEIKSLRESVAMLLAHDAERDVEGKRYGGETETP